MHPAFSVIIFTSLSGAGYGSLAILGALKYFDFFVINPLLGFLSSIIAILMITIGLISSTTHLGHPGRAWRALSHWRSSWLSREGVFAVLTYFPASIFCLSFLIPGAFDEIINVVCLLTTIFSLGTIYCTAKIYSSLKTIRQWNHQLVMPIYLIIGLFDGAILLLVLLAIFDSSQSFHFHYFIILLGTVAGLAKILYWWSIDNADSKSNTSTATGLGTPQEGVSMLDGPTTSETFIMREMGFVIARKHSRRLRLITILTLSIIPISAVYLIAQDPMLISQIILSLIAIVFSYFGTIIERWLFFAEAKHVSMLYYGATKV